MATGIRDILTNLEGPGSAIGGGIGAFTPVGPIGGAAIGGGIGSLIKLGVKGYDWLTGREEELSPEEQAQQEVLQRLRGRLGQGTDDIVAEAQRGFREDTVPEILQRIMGDGGGRTSALPMALGQAGVGLQQRLASLRENIERGRLGDLSQYLSGQQNVGLQLQQLGQRQRESARSAIGQGIPYGAQLSQDQLNQLLQTQNAQGQQANIGLGRQAVPVTAQSQNIMNRVRAMSGGDDAAQAIRDIIAQARSGRTANATP